MTIFIGVFCFIAREKKFPIKITKCGQTFENRDFVVCAFRIFICPNWFGACNTQSPLLLWCFRGPRVLWWVNDCCLPIGVHWLGLQKSKAIVGNSNGQFKKDLIDIGV